MESLIPITGELTGVYTKPIELTGSFMALARRFSATPGAVVLLSGGALDSARYHILAARPWLSLSGTSRGVEITAGNNTIRSAESAFNALQRLQQIYALPYQEALSPVAAGLFGYLSYDLKDELEVLPNTAMDDLRLPRLLLFAPSIIVIHDQSNQTTRLLLPERVKAGVSSVSADLQAFEAIMAQPLRPSPAFCGGREDLRANFSQPEYLQAVKTIKEYIAAGDVYQVNLSQRFETSFSGEPFALFEHLYARNPAPFFAYINAGDHHIVSTSPERFLLREGRRVETRPIKGTRPRGRDDSEDLRLRAELAASSKDDAELSMIVDLLRNDLGKVCQAGSVRVAAHKAIEAYANVYHLVSTVTGRLDEGLDSVALVRAAFPGGSITGCPKIRAMEIIDELEPHRRHIYTGAIGYLSFHDTLDLSIAIRTAVIAHERIYFSVGGGIVFDSDPEDEYRETLHKGRTLTAAIAGDSKNQAVGQNPISAQRQVWLNGKLVLAEQASVPLLSLGFQYGCGVFETIRCAAGKPLWLAAHLARFHHAWQALFADDPPDQTWAAIIDQVIRANRLTQEVAAVKIIGARLTRTAKPFDYLLAVTARPYTERPALKNSPGLRLATYPHPRLTPLADYKTLNYFYYHQAEAWAAQQQADMALILNPDGTVSETGVANLLLIQGKTVILPQSPYMLPGIAQAKILAILTAQGYSLETRPVRPEALCDVDLILATNSLMGFAPIASLDGKPLPLRLKACPLELIRATLF